MHPIAATAVLGLFLMQAASADHATQKVAENRGAEATVPNSSELNLVDEGSFNRLKTKLESPEIKASDIATLLQAPLQFFCKGEDVQNVQSLATEHLRRRLKSEEFKTSYLTLVADDARRALRLARTTDQLLTSAWRYRFTPDGKAAAEGALTKLLDRGQFFSASLVFDGWLQDNQGSLCQSPSEFAVGLKGLAAFRHSRSASEVEELLTQLKSCEKFSPALKTVEGQLATLKIRSAVSLSQSWITPLARGQNDSSDSEFSKMESEGRDLMRLALLYSGKLPKWEDEFRRQPGRTYFYSCDHLFPEKRALDLSPLHHPKSLERLGDLSATYKQVNKTLQASLSKEVLRAWNKFEEPDLHVSRALLKIAPDSPQGEAVAEILTDLAVRDPEHHEHLIEELGEKRFPSALSAYVFQTNYRNLFNRRTDEQVVEALKTSSNPYLKKFAEKIKNRGLISVDVAALSTLSGYERAEEELAALATSPDESVRVLVASALGDLKQSSKGRSVLHSLLKDPRRSVRQAAIVQLLQIRPASQETVALLLKQARTDVDPSLRALSLEILTREDSRNLVPDMIPLLDDENPRLVGNVVSALGANLTNEAFDALKPIALGNRHPEQQGLALLAFPNSGEKRGEILNILLAMQSVPNQTVAKCASQALYRFGDINPDESSIICEKLVGSKHPELDNLRKRAIERVPKTAENADVLSRNLLDEPVRTAARGVLLEIGSPAVPALEAFAKKTTDPLLQSLAKEIISEIKEQKHQTP